MNKVLVKLYVPMIEEHYDVLIPLNKKIYEIIKLLVKAINEFNGNYSKPSNTPVLYDKLTATQYDFNQNVKEAGIRNGTEIVLIF